MIAQHLRLRLEKRGMHFEGELKGSIQANGKWWVDFQRKLKDLGFVIEQVSQVPRNVHSPRVRG